MYFVMCPLSPTPTATATDPPPVNSPTMRSRLAGHDIICFVFGNQTIYSKIKKYQNQNKCPKLYRKKDLSFEILPVRSLTRNLFSLILAWLAGFMLRSELSRGWLPGNVPPDNERKLAAGPLVFCANL